MHDHQKKRIAYFSMEVALNSQMKTYSGGLGVLAGDMLTSAADLRVPMIGVTLLNRKGYFHQVLDPSGAQKEEPDLWPVDNFLTKEDARISVTIENRPVYITAWKYEIVGISGYKVPIYFLDTNLEENSDWDKTLTDYLYGEDMHYRLCQEVVLGIGGLRILRVLGYTELERYHMNEGHAALLAFELLENYIEKAEKTTISKEDIEAVRENCIFTTHTPVPAGQDKFPMDMVSNVLGPHEVFKHPDLFTFEGLFNMTFLALNLSKYVNGVSKKHAKIGQLLYTPFKPEAASIDAITNGVHAVRWTAEPFQNLYDQYIPGWRDDNFSLRHALVIPKQQFWEAHLTMKRALFDHVKKVTGTELDFEILTIGFARRVATYKRASLLFQDIERLRRIASQTGRLQIIFAGKAHPYDNPGKEVIKQLFQSMESLKKDVKIVYLPDYDLELGKLMTSGVDVWLNTPEPKLEASGTSGMKAALNGVPSFSILDGWWNEGCIEGMTGWAISKDIRPESPTDLSQDANSLYEKLEKVIIPLYHNRDQFINLMLHSVALNGSFFHSQRMVLQYDVRAYMS